MDPLHSWLDNFTAGHDDKTIIRKMKLQFLIAFLGNKRYGASHVKLTLNNFLKEQLLQQMQLRLSHRYQMDLIK